MPIFSLTNTHDFPPVSMAEEDGLLAIGGDLSPNRLISAYKKGIFPWYSKGSPILWWSPDPRMVLFPSDLKVSKSMRQILRSGKFRVTFDDAFDQVIEACGKIARPGQDGTWLVEEMKIAYLKLHQLGIAHSVEVWRNEELVGGLYGLVVGGVFCGESMFSKESNASKTGFIHLVKHLHSAGFQLIDCQVHTQHLESLGAKEIPRNQFIRLLEANSDAIFAQTQWQAHPEFLKKLNFD